MSIMDQVTNVINEMIEVVNRLVAGETNAHQYMAILLAAFCFSIGLDIIIALLGKNKHEYMIKEE